MISYRIHAKCRLHWKNCLSECLLPKADKVEAEGCQDPRQLLVLLFFGSLVCCSCCHNVSVPGTLVNQSPPRHCKRPYVEVTHG